MRIALSVLHCELRHPANLMAIMLLPAVIRFKETSKLPPMEMVEAFRVKYSARMKAFERN